MGESQRAADCVSSGKLVVHVLLCFAPLLFCFSHFHSAFLIFSAFSLLLLKLQRQSSESSRDGLWQNWSRFIDSNQWKIICHCSPAMANNSQAHNTRHTPRERHSTSLSRRQVAALLASSGQSFHFSQAKLN